MKLVRINSLSAANKSLLYNSIGAILIKGGGIIVGIISVPLYMRYFPDNTSLGVWYTILNVLSWILNFDLGVGNGLRNLLTIAIANNDKSKAKELISSSYIILGFLMMILGITFFIASQFINWNNFFNVSEDIINPGVLRTSVNITLIGILFSFFTRIIGSILYSLQKAAINNILGFSTNVLMVVYLFFFKSTGDANSNLFYLSIYNALATNIPFVIATFYCFRQPFIKECFPSFSYFRFSSAKDVLGLGSLFLVLQLLFMALCGTNEWFIAKFFDPSFCVDYNIYNKVFSLIGSFSIMALTPLWSAFTKASAEKNYKWLKKAQRLLYIGAVGTVLLQLAIIPFMEQIINIWLKDKAIDVNMSSVWVFFIYGSLLIINNVESTIVCGLGKLKVQLVGYVFAVLVKIIGIVVLSKMFDNWTLVVLITSIGLLPYLIIQPFYINKELAEYKV